MRVLVTGATGFVGERLVPALVAAGHDVVSLVRDPERYDPPEGVSAVAGDLLDAEPGTPAGDDLRAALTDVDAAYYLVHSMGEGGDFAEKDRRCASNFATAASDAGVARVVYLGGLGDEADELSEHLQSRREVERLLAAGEFALTTLRAGILVGDGGAGFEVVRQLSARLPVMVTPRWVDTPCQPIAVEDVIICLAGVLDHPTTAGETYELGGPEVLSYGEFLRRTRAQLGHRLLLVPVPVITPGLSAHWLRLVTDVPLRVARPLVKGLRNPVTTDDDRLFDLLGVERTSLDAAIARALGPTGDTRPTSRTTRGEPAGGGGGHARRPDGGTE
jgi:uncharacterized protein YbjT (DUF2867 family)